MFKKSIYSIIICIGIVASMLIGSSSVNLYIKVVSVSVILCVAEAIMRMCIFIPINRLKEDILKIKNGDYSIKLSEDTYGIVLDLALELDDIIMTLGELIMKAQLVSNTLIKQTETVQDSYSNCLLSAEDISRNVSEVAQVTQNQSVEAEKVMEEGTKLSEAVDFVSNAINEAIKMCFTVQEATNNGLNNVKYLTETTDESIKVAENAMSSVQNIADSSKQINTVLETISEIANKTNLLSLNASIEAARAGEAGKGFSVVATEIRKLAEQSKLATESIRTIVDDINKKTSHAVSSMLSTKDINNNQINAVNNTEKSFNIMSKELNGLASSITNVGELNVNMISQKNTIDECVQLLASGISQISASTQEISASTEEQLAMLNEVNSITGQFKMLSDKFSEEVSKYKVM